MQTPRKFMAIAGIAIVGLSACESSPCDLSASASQSAAADQLLNCVGTLNPTPVAQMPTSGTATYNGYASGQFAPTVATTDNLVGDAVLTANFSGPGSVTGVLSNFNSTAQGNLTGTLAVTSGAITGNLVNVSVSGTLTGISNSVNFATSGSGVFLGGGADGFLAGTTGSAITGAFTDPSAALTIFVLQ